MSCYCCRNFLAFLLKFLNFIQTFIGVSMILYSVWMLNRWNNLDRIPQSLAPSGNVLPTVVNLYGLDDGFNHMSSSIGIADGLPQNARSQKLVAQISSGFEDGLDFNFDNLPAPWFIYSLLGIGILLCLITCIGHIAAEAINGCCLCFYTILTAILLLFEVALVGDILFNEHWEEDLPYDPTGECERVRSFIVDNIRICKWVGIVIVTVQALSLLLAMILRAMVSTRAMDYDSDDDYAILRGGHWQPQLNPQGSQSSASTWVGNAGIRSDVWSTRMREKYGLNPGESTYNMLDSKPSIAVKTKQ